MNRRTDYDGVDWYETDVRIAEKLGVTRQAVSAARKVRGIPSVVGHGGYRKGAGRGDKESPPSEALRRPKSAGAQYDGVDWLQTDGKIAEALGVTQEAVYGARKARGIPRYGTIGWKRGIPRNQK